MEYYTQDIDGGKVQASLFSQNSVTEMQLLVTPPADKVFEDQMSHIVGSIQTYLQNSAVPLSSVVFIRFFVSDYTNQHDDIGMIEEISWHVFERCAVSIVQQPPLDNNKIAAWVYCIHDECEQELCKECNGGNGIAVKRNGYEHIWNTQLKTDNGAVDSLSQTENIFKRFTASLEEKGCSLKNNCMRTWLFVKDIDFNYHGVVKARRVLFVNHDLTHETHYIASTGIEGRYADPNISVLMDAYSVNGINQEQVAYLEAREHLNPTHEYGVTFERGTSIDFGDRRHIYISGTASINNLGEVLYPNDVGRQAERVMENIDALLADADASMDDVAQMIVYLRDITDAGKMNSYFSQYYQDVPKVVVLAPVCRPGWLVEIECVAVKAIDNGEFRNF